MTSMMAGSGSIRAYFGQSSGGMNQHEIVATSLVAMVPTGLGGTLMNSAQGNVHFRLGTVLALSSAATMYLTAKYAAPEIKVRSFCSELTFCFHVFVDFRIVH